MPPSLLTHSRISIAQVLPMFLSVGSLVAQANDTPATPEAVVVALFEAQAEADWPRFLRLTHRDARDMFKQDVVKAAVRLENPTRPYDRRSAEQFLTLLFGVRSEVELRRIPADTLLIRYLAYTRDACGTFCSDRRATALHPAVLGHVLDGDSVAYIVLKELLSPSDLRTDSSALAGPEQELRPLVDIMTLRRDTSGDWRSMLDGGVFYSRGGFALGPRDGFEFR